MIDPLEWTLTPLRLEELFTAKSKKLFSPAAVMAPAANVCQPDSKAGCVTFPTPICARCQYWLSLLVAAVLASTV